MRSARPSSFLHPARPFAPLRRQGLPALRALRAISVGAISVGALVLPPAAAASEAAPIPPAQHEFFESKIRPALAKHCYQCHAEEGDQIRGGLLLDTREATRYGGDSGPAVVPGDLDASLLYQAILYDDPELEMPPKYRLSPAVVEDFKAWIEMGAPDPRDTRSAPLEGGLSYTSTIDYEAGLEHWAYQPPRAPSVPVPQDEAWRAHPIDAFVAARLESEGLPLPGEAEPSTLLRRLHFDLVGLPPTPEDLERFLPAYEASPESVLAAEVDRLLASERFGEKWGRHWLDVARYAESTGREVNATFPHAWRYRDYVIDSYNRDKPFGRFILEQLAGDLLPWEDEAARADQLVATGFLAIGAKALNEANARQFRFDLVDEQIDATTQAFLATTAACARCHDHKSEPVSMRDYYALAGILLSSEPLFGTAPAQQNRKSTALIALPAGPASTPPKSLGELIDLEFQLAQLEERRAQLLAEAAELRRTGDTDGAARRRIQTLNLDTLRGPVAARLAAHDDEGRPLALAMGMRDRPEPFDAQLLLRGEEDQPSGERVPRGVLTVLAPETAPVISGGESGRLQMAEWIASEENPLTARVYANRLWAWMLGEGIVPSVDNFGFSGEAPSHPELLDWLALRLVERDLSTKAVVREIALSRAYRSSSAYDAAAFEKDPENRLLWRAHPRRLGAEAFRDAMLAVAGSLELERPAGSLVARLGDGFVGRTISEQQINAESGSRLRSVYLPVVRDLVPEALALFDFPDPSLLAGQRENTTVPSQALYLMNSPFVLETAEAFAARLLAAESRGGEPPLDAAFVLALSRGPSADERERAAEFVARFAAAVLEQGSRPEEARRLALAAFCQSLFCSSEFRIVN